MKTGHKVVKYFAYGLAILIIVSIIELIATGLNWFTFEETVLETPIKKTFEVENEEITTFDLVVNVGEIEIKTGEFGYETNYDKISANISHGRFVVEDTTTRLKKYTNNIKLIIYIPKGYTFEKGLIKTGAAKLTAEELNVKSLDMKLGASNTVIKKFVVSENLKLESGAGSLNLKNVNINNLNTDLGVGKTSIKGIIRGDSKITCGVGELDLELTDSEENYKIEVEKGIGEIRINGDKKSNGTYGKGKNTISIEGGIGSVSINYLEEK